MTPEGWEQARLESYLDLMPGYAFKSSQFSSDPSDGPPLIRIRDLTSQAPDVFYLGDAAPQYLIDPGDILVGMDGDFDIRRWSGPRSLLNQRVCRIASARPREASTDFLYYLLDRHLGALHAAISGTTVKHLSTKHLKNLAVDLPPLPEQKKIAEILGSVDEAIQATQAVIDQTRKVKQGLLQQLLTRGIGHTRFKQTEIGEIPESWEAQQLGSLLERIDAGWSPTCVDHPPSEGQWGVLKVSAVTTGTFQEQESKTLPSELSPRPDVRVSKGDVLVARANGVAQLVGRAAMVLREPKGLLMLSDKTLRLIPRASRLLPIFLLMQLQSTSIREQIERSWGGSSGQKNISQSSIRSFRVGVPPIEEQARVSVIWSSLTASLEEASETLTRLGEVKRGLMQDLLSGRIRVAA